MRKAGINAGITEGHVMHGPHKALDDARREAYSMQLQDIDVSQPDLFRSNTMWPYFERLRKEDPVHYCPESRVGPYWSVTKYNDIMRVETNHRIFSSDVNLGGIGIQNTKPDYRRESFIAMDEPRHSEQRKYRGTDVPAAKSRPAGEHDTGASPRDPGPFATE